MVGPDTKVKVLGLSGSLHNTTISDVFDNFADKGLYYGNMKLIDFGNINAMIKSHTGWSKLLKIQKVINIPHEQFVKVRILCSDNVIREIFVTRDELLPIYNHTKSKTGFHGERKFAYTLCNPDRILSGGTMRLDGEFNDDSEKLDFFTPIAVECDGDAPTSGFQVVTLSRFFTGNDISLYASDEIPIEAVKEWGWV